MSTVFNINLIYETAKFNIIKRYYNNKYIVSDEYCKININKKIFQQKMKFILSLLCDFSSEINIKLCDLEEIHEQNKYYRQKDKPTDVLSFPIFPQVSETMNELGDILICLPICTWQAKKFGYTLNEEIERLIIHGLLHLKGFDHERSKRAFKVQSSLEESIVRELNLEYKKDKWISLIDYPNDLIKKGGN